MKTGVNLLVNRQDLGILLKSQGCGPKEKGGAPAENGESKTGGRANPTKEKTVKLRAGVRIN